MAAKVTTWLVDDIDGSDAIGTTRFGLDKIIYEIDLSMEHESELRQALHKFIPHARIVSQPRPANTPSLRPRNQLALQRWAREQKAELKRQEDAQIERGGDGKAPARSADEPGERGTERTADMTMQAATPQIPGLTASEITAMQAAAARLLHGAEPDLAAVIQADLGELARPASSGASGTASASVATYARQNQSHFMLMACHAAG